MHRKDRRKATALTIAGSDSGGGAGVQADLRVFNELGVHGTTVLTCVTAQNPLGVTAVQPIRPLVVRRQLEAVFGELKPQAVKTGMLFSAALVREVAAALSQQPGLPFVLDPVMIATSGARLLKPDAVRALQSRLCPLATLLTPNRDEAEALADLSIRHPDDLRRAARALRDRFGCAVLVKGGHLPGPEAVDLFWDGREEWLLVAPRVRGVSTHGTGCTYSAAIVAGLCRGLPLPTAVVQAKAFISQAIAASAKVGSHWVLGAGIPGSRRC